MGNERVDQLIQNEVERWTEALLQGHVARTITQTSAAHVLGNLAQQLRQIMQSEYALSLMTTDEVAAQLRISSRRVRALAVSRQIGWQAGRGVWVFRAEDVEAMRVRIPGRPRATE